MNIWTLESEFIARWGAQVPGLQIISTFDDIDWTDASAPKVGAQVVFDGIEQGNEVRSAALVPFRYSAHVFLDVKRASSADKQLAAQGVEQATRAATGWEFSPNFYTRLAGGQRTGFDGRIVRVSVSFLLTAVAQGLA